MADKESKRICFKCGRSPASDNVKLFRFPKPAVRNLVRCQLWARYIFPDRNPTMELQQKLHSEHRMLCQIHFKDSDFNDSSKQILQRNAVPSDDETVSVHPTFAHANTEPVPGPSQRIPLVNIGNISTFDETVSVHPTIPNTEPVAESSQRMPLVNIGNIPSFTENITEMQNIDPQAGPSPSHKIHNVEKKKVSVPRTGTTTPINEEEEKENKLLEKCTKYMRKTYELRNRIKNLKAKQVLKHLDEEKCIRKLSEKLTPGFALLLQSQIRNHNKKLTGRRWSKDDKITALRIYKRSPTCYRLLRRLFKLPSPTTLKALLNKVPFNVGTNPQVFNVIKEHIKCQKPSDNNYVLMFDEMSLKKHLQYNVKYDFIEGYQDHAVQGRSPLIASYALVFMIAGIRKRVKQPIAHYFSSGFSTADRLVVLIKEVLQQCFEAGINISAIVCDMDGVNRRALTILGATIEHPFITFSGKEIVTLYDPPHLLKCFRNMFLKYNIECSTDISDVQNTAGKGVAKWSHFVNFYELDSRNKNFCYAPALKKDHLTPNTKQKMKVKLAAQVFSHSVAGGMYSKIDRGELPAEAVVTANVASNMDRLFDCLNSDQSNLRGGKPHATNLTAVSPHLELLKKMRDFFRHAKFIGSPRKPPSQDGWIWTLNAVERLWKNLRNTYKINSLATRRLQQDPIENLFGCIRGNCGSNTNPTTGQFVAGFKTAILSNLANMGTTGNCEIDNNVIINNLDKLLSVSNPGHTQKPQTETEPVYRIELPDMEEVLNTDSAEIQACTYVCGFLVKHFPTVCHICKSILISNVIESHHSFVEWREYNDLKKSLNYVTKNFVDCVECCATLINNFLREHGHVNNLKKCVINNITSHINFNFLNECQEHKEKNVHFIINSVFFICVKRFCILENRKFADEASTSALKKKMAIIVHK